MEERLAVKEDSGADGGKTTATASKVLTQWPKCKVISSVLWLWIVIPNAGPLAEVDELKV